MKNNFPIIIRIQGGLGNQLYQYAFGRSLSLHSGRPILLETRNISRDSSRKYELSAFNIKEEFPGLFTKWCVRWAASESSGNLFRTLFPPARNYKIIKDKETGFDPSIFNLENGTLIFEGYWQSFKYFTSCQEIIKNELTFKTRPSSINAQWLETIKSSESVAVHVRRGDYVTNPKCKDLHGICTLDYYKKAADYLTRHVDDPCFYIITDDPEWARNELTLPVATKVIDHNLGKTDNEDFRLMTYCKHFIIANSSFSWWGAWLAFNPEKIVIAPKKWFKIDNFPPEDRIPEDWVRL